MIVRLMQLSLEMPSVKYWLLLEALLVLSTDVYYVLIKLLYNWLEYCSWRVCNVAWYVSFVLESLK